MSGKDLVRWLLCRGKDVSDIAKITGLGQRRIYDFKKAIEENTNTKNPEVNSSVLRNFCLNTDVTPCELYQIVTDRKYDCNKLQNSTFGLELASKNDKIKLLEDQLAKEHTEVIFLRDLVKKLTNKETV